MENTGFYKNSDGTYDKLTKGSKVKFFDNSSMVMGETEYDELTVGKIYTVKKIITYDEGEAQFCTLHGFGDWEYHLARFEDLENPMYNELIVDVAH